MSEMLHEKLREIADSFLYIKGECEPRLSLQKAADMLEPIETLLNGGAVHWEDSDYYLVFNGRTVRTLIKKTNKEDACIYDGSDIIEDYHNLKPYTPKPVYKDGTWYWCGSKHEENFKEPMRWNAQKDCWDVADLHRCGVAFYALTNPKTGQPWEVEGPKNE